MAILPESCLGCKGCCTNTGAHLDPGGEGIPEEYKTFRVRPMVNGEDKIVEIMKQKENGECICLDENGHCIIYESRPRVCREFERGSPACHLYLDNFLAGRDNR